MQFFTVFYQEVISKLLKKHQRYKLRPAKETRPCSLAFVLNDF